MPGSFRIFIGDAAATAVIERASAEREIVEALDEIGAVGGRTEVGLPAVLELDADPMGVASISTAAGGML